MNRERYNQPTFQKLACLLAAVCLVILAPFQAHAEALQGSIEFTDGNYRVGAGDVLSVFVYHQKDLSQTGILVRPDGLASFNGIGEVEVAGRTVSELNKILTKELAELVISPRVSVNIDKMKPGTVFLAGAVTHPGMYQLDPNAAGSKTDGAISRSQLRLSNILSNAGGVKMSADLTKVQVRRGDTVVRTVDLWKLLQNGAGSSDVYLQSGDTVFVPQLPQMAMSDAQYELLLQSSIGPKSFPVRVIGEVKTPGVYRLQGDSPFLNSAVAKAGGYKESANQKVVAIRRFANENDMTTLFVDPQKLDVTLRPNDVLYISEAKVYKAGKFMDSVNRILSPFTSLGTTALGFSVVNGN
ncbi:MAG: polysaccharide biosynthesis/export family protein [Vampirovibrio sp.]|nr:polysaccharide biosynthesis/export family protein [Vampirovibrio sp.]